MTDKTEPGRKAKLWQRDYERAAWVSATTETVVTALQANPQLRAEVLEAIIGTGQDSRATYELQAKLRAAEAELATERARGRKLEAVILKQSLALRYYREYESPMHTCPWGTRARFSDCEACIAESPSAAESATTEPGQITAAEVLEEFERKMVLDGLETAAAVRDLMKADQPAPTEAEPHQRRMSNFEVGEVWVGSGGGWSRNVDTGEVLSREELDARYRHRYGLCEPEPQPAEAAGLVEIDAAAMHEALCLTALRRIVRKTLACGQLEKLEDARRYLDQPAPAEAEGSYDRGYNDGLADVRGYARKLKP